METTTALEDAQLKALDSFQEQTYEAFRQIDSLLYDLRREFDSLQQGFPAHDDHMPVARQGVQIIERLLQRCSESFSQDGSDMTGFLSTIARDIRSMAVSRKIEEMRREVDATPSKTG